MAEQRARRRAGVRSVVVDSRPWRAGASAAAGARRGPLLIATAVLDALLQELVVDLC